MTAETDTLTETGVRHRLLSRAQECQLRANRSTGPMAQRWARVACNLVGTRVVTSGCRAAEADGVRHRFSSTPARADFVPIAAQARNGAVEGASR